MMAPRDSPFAVAVAAVRSTAAYLVVSLYTLLAGPPGILLAHLFGPNVLYRLGQIGVEIGLLLTGMRYEVSGAEHIQTTRAAVYCVNHSSNVEPPILYLALSRLFPRLRVLYKAELHAALPVLSSGFDLVGFVPIARGDRDQSRRAIDHAAAALRAGNSFLIFPEGTRSRTGQLLPFKKGGFLMALKGSAPIVPIAIVGARDAMRKGSPIIRPVTIRVTLGPPVETDGMTLADRNRLTTEVRGRIEGLLGRS